MSNLEKDFGEFVSEIKSKILDSQYKALRSVNKELINLYWNIGKQIFEKQKEAKWGDSIVEELSKEIQKEFVGIKGFSARNLWLMKEFYDSYYKNEKLQLLVAEISWVKNILIMSKCKDDLQREFYIKMTKKFGWTKNILKVQIENHSYEKYLTNQTNFEKNLSKELKSQAKLAVKDEYTFDFLELGKEHSEREFEKALT
jgi:predicted nuclease of restriction endonuclease-like (RecB) superfamily